MTKELNNYFNRARLWADDNFTQLQYSRNRYQLAFLLGLILNIISIITIMILVNIQTLVPLIIHHYDNGITTVDALNKKKFPINKEQIQSDIWRYVINRESYDISSYRAQFDLINILSSNTVNAEYVREQQKENHLAPINTLGANIIRKVHVYNINFLDQLILNEQDLTKNHQNVAEVVFSLIDEDKIQGTTTHTHYNALISWNYVKPSSSPTIRWQNWDGFQVIRYSKQLRNVK